MRELAEIALEEIAPNDHACQAYVKNNKWKIRVKGVVLMFLVFLLILFPPKGLKQRPNPVRVR